MEVFAALVEGEGDWAELFFVVAFILFVIEAVWHKSLIAVGLAAMALAFILI